MTTGYFHYSEKNRSWKDRMAISYLMAPKEAQLLHFFFDEVDNKKIVKRFDVDKEFYIDRVTFRQNNGVYKLSEGLFNYKDVTIDNERKVNEVAKFLNDQYC